ncbi:MAG: hypothetical protein GY754_23035, partial [bacterium]|nr:hypothetical protein [bacterium]
FTVEGADTGTVTMSKGLSISTGENCAIKVSKGMEYKSGADVIVKGSAIELKANGTTAESKQIAAKDDQVVGVDVHIEMVVAGPALVPVPIPNPYIGILNDKLSADVKFNARPVATKGSKSLGVGPGHVLLSGVSFQKPPSNIGEVTSATIPSVMVNGKEVAVLSSAVKTCHDPVDAENCKIIAMGTAVPIPIQIPGLEGPLVVNTRSPIFEGEETPEERSLSNPMWGSSTAMVGEEIELSVSLVNQYEGAGVRFNIWEEGADRETDWPAAVVVGKNEGGRAAAKWIYRFQYDRNNPLTEKPKFVFTATSFGCEEVEAGVVEIHDNMVVRCVDAFGEILSDLKYSLPDLGTEGTSDADGIIREEDIPPGQKVIFDFTGFRKTGEKTTPDGPLNEEGKENKNFRIKDAQLEEGIFIDTFYATEIVFPTLVLRMAFDLTEFETEDDKYTLFSTDSNEYYRNELTCQDDRVEGDEYVDLHFVGVRRDINYSLEVEIGENEDRYFLFEDKFLDNLIR